MHLRECLSLKKFSSPPNKVVDWVQLRLQFFFQVIASAALNVFDDLLKLDLETHLLPKNWAKRQITSTIILTAPNMVITEDKGTFANPTSLYLAFVGMNNQLFHLRTSLWVAIEILAIPSMDQVIFFPFEQDKMFHW